MRDNDLVIFCEHKALYSMKGEVPEGEYVIPFGQANIVREGKDATIVTYAWMAHRSLEAAKLLEKKAWMWK